MGWGDGFDEVVPRSRLQLDDNAIEKTQQQPAPTFLIGPSFGRMTSSSRPEKTEKGDVPADAGPIASTGRTVNADTKLERNQVLQVEWGRTWWAARIMELLPGNQARIHYLGWDSGWDEVVPRSRLQLDDNAIEKTQQQPALGPSFAPSFQPEKTEKGDVPANPGPIASTRRAVTADTKLALNQVLQVEEFGEWFAARVLELLPDGRVKIHYLGWGSMYDEVVPRSRLQLDDNAIEKTQQDARR
jgi:hypothetical protein